MLPILALAAFAVFLWSVIGLINPKWGRISNRWVSIPIWFVSFILLLIVGAIGTDDTTERSVAPTKAHAVPPPPVETSEEAEARKMREEADRIVKARKKLFDDGRIFAGIYCAEQVEARARFGVQWTNGFLEQKFPVGQWQKETASEKIVLYMGDKVEFQNRYGTWEGHLYECLVDVKNEKILSVTVAPRT